MAGNRNIQSEPAPERSDAELLQAVAAGRDEAAFAELFRRYERAAYGLALQITGSHASAEEAAQEAFLRVWLRAENFRASEGQPRSWLLQIFARESLKMIRRRKKAVRAAEKEATRQALDAAGAREPKEAPSEREELLAALRRGVSSLPESTRQMVALYFGAGLSQEEIGKELEVSQTTVSLRITSAMNELRANLGKAGFAAAVPMLESGALQDAILESGHAPSSLLANIQGQLTNAARVTGRISRRVAASAGTGKTVAAVAVLAMAAGAAWYANTTAEPRAPGAGALSGSLEKTAEQPGPGESAPAPAAPLLPRRWNFKQGPSEGLYAFQGKLLWKQAEDGGVLETSQDELVCVLLAMKFPPRSFSVTVTLKRIGTGRHAIDLIWMNKEGGQSYRSWIVPQNIVSNPGGRLEVEFFFQDDLILKRYDGLPWVACKYDRPYPGDRLAFMLRNWQIYSIEILDRSSDTSKDDRERMFSEAVKILKNPDIEPKRILAQPLDWSHIPEKYR